MSLEFLKVLCTLEQNELRNFLAEFLKEYYSKNEIFEGEKWIYAQGDNTLLVAHLDTVHKTKPTEATIYHDSVKNVLWSTDGIGGDDRCGVYIICMLVMEGYKPSIAFMHDEEIGCIGSGEFIKEFTPNNLYQLNFAIQFDRKGHQESVYYQCENDEFETYINSFGFNTKIGSYTDICVICPSYGIAGVNLSAGYQNEHTKSEIIMLDTLRDTMSKASQILNDQLINPSYFQYVERKKVYPTHNKNYYDSYYYYDYDNELMQANEATTSKDTTGKKKKRAYWTW